MDKVFGVLAFACWIGILANLSVGNLLYAAFCAGGVWLFAQLEQA